MIGIVANAVSDDYDLKIPKGPTDIVVKAIGDAASNLTTNLGAAGAGGLSWPLELKFWTPCVFSEDASAGEIVAVGGECAS